MSRERRNVVLFIVSYVINNLASGVLYDTYVNYLQDVATSAATSFWAFYGYATFVAAALLLLVPKIGYKRLLVFCSAGTAAAFFAAVAAPTGAMIYLATLLALTGVQLHFIMLSPYVAAYTDSESDDGITWYTRTYYLGYVGYLLATYFGGLLVVVAFAQVAHIGFGQAQELTRFIEEMSPVLYASYLEGTRAVLLVVGAIAALSLIPVLMIREHPEDYRRKPGEDEQREALGVRLRKALHLLTSRPALAYLVYWALISFAMGLFTSYYTVYLNRVLHIDRATASLMVSVSYVAIVVFMFFTPRVVKKIGKVGTIVFTVLTSIPFMLIIANGDRFGSAVVAVVGAALFIRAGLANLSSPADSALSMDVVPRDLRPIFTAMVNFTAGIISILSGNFTGSVLFVNESGYRVAYYIAAVLYGIAALVLWFGCKGFNEREEEDSHE